MSVLANENNSDNPHNNPWSTPPKTSSAKGNASQTPWEEAVNRRRKNGTGGGSGGGNEPPFIEVLKNIFDGGSQSPKRVFIIAAAGLIVLWLLSGFFRVLPEENAVILRFGKYTSTITDPGLHYTFPSPIGTVFKPNVTFERRIELGYRGAAFQGAAKEDVPEESMILTGDANIVDLDFVVQWKVADAKKFLFNIRDPEATLKRVAESAMREVVGQNKLQDIITDSREDISARVKKIMQDILSSYQSGIMVTQVLIQDASVPQPVLDAFEDVIRAQQQAETMRNQALRYRNEIVPRAQGESIRLIKEAEGYKEQIVSQAKGDAQRFTDVYTAYSTAKNVTRDRLFIETWEDILQNSDALILDTQKSGTMPYINLNDLRGKKTKTVTDSNSVDIQQGDNR